MDKTRALGQRCAALAFESYSQGLRRQGLRATIAALALYPTQPSRGGLVSTSVRSIIGRRAAERLPRLRSVARPGRKPAVDAEAELRRRLADCPGDADRHLALGVHYLDRGLQIRGYACLRGAKTLARLGGGAEREIAGALRAAEEALGLTTAGLLPSIELEAQEDPYGRLRFLAGHVMSFFESGPLRVLDVGGGEGFLAALLPRTDYLLVEPPVNGLSAEHLPSNSLAFDVVVCSHMLEHIEPGRREGVVAQMLGAARCAVLILGPFAPAGARLQTDEAVLAATGTSWAREHVEYGLPSLEAMRGLLEKRRLRFDVLPHADARVMYWQFLATHFADLAGEAEALRGATAFFRQQFDYRPAEPQHPHDFLVRILLSRAGR